MIINIIALKIFLQIDTNYYFNSIGINETVPAAGEEIESDFSKYASVLKNAAIIKGLHSSIRRINIR